MSAPGEGINETRLGINTVLFAYWVGLSLFWMLSGMVCENLSEQALLTRGQSRLIGIRLPKRTRHRVTTCNRKSDNGVGATLS
jgi:hypothetical protein